jgi:hypothetical protein
VPYAGRSGEFLPPSPPAEKTTAGKPATIARIMVGGGPFYSHAPGLPDGRGKLTDWVPVLVVALVVVCVTAYLLLDPKFRAPKR